MTGGAGAAADGAAPALAPGDVEALLGDVFAHTGIDFRQYVRRGIERRLRHLLLQDGTPSVATLRARIAAGGAPAARALADRLCVTVTTIFRDPPFWVALREELERRLGDAPFVRAWSAGCASGEEAYSLAILLREAGFEGRARVYATDIDEGALAAAHRGALDVNQVPEYTHNYIRAGGTRAFSEYYLSGADTVALAPSLRRMIVFSRHNLATDGIFHSFHVVLCRNVLIYFDAPLQARAHALLAGSVAGGGLLGLGLREMVPRAAPEDAYDELNGTVKLFLRRGAV